MSANLTVAGAAGAVPRIAVMIVDSQVLFGSGLARLLDEDDRLSVARVCRAGEDVPVLCESLGIDVLITDIEVGGVSAVDCIQDLAGRSTGTRVLIVATRADWRVVPALQAGAAGFLLKEADPDSIRSAVVSVHLGEQVLCQEAVRWLLGASADRRLTRRESDVLRLMARGVANKEIGRILNLGDKTVRNYVSRLYRKLEVSTRADLAIAANFSEHGALQPGPRGDT